MQGRYQAGKEHAVLPGEQFELQQHPLRGERRGQRPGTFSRSEKFPRRRERAKHFPVLDIREQRRQGFQAVFGVFRLQFFHRSAPDFDYYHCSGSRFCAKPIKIQQLPAIRFWGVSFA